MPVLDHTHVPTARLMRTRASDLDAVSAFRATGAGRIAVKVVTARGMVMTAVRHAEDVK